MCIRDSAKGDTDTLMRIAEEKEKGNLQSDSIHFTPYDEAVYSYMKLIVEENLPLAILQSKNFKAFSKHNISITKKAFKDILSSLVVLVKMRIKDMMHTAKYGSVLHDGWTHLRIHYIGLLACFTLKTLHPVAKAETYLVLLSCAPMAKQSDRKLYLEHTHTENFTASTHTKHIKQIFYQYGINEVKNWAICQTADNCSGNKSVAKLLEIPHVACKNHLRNKFCRECGK